MINEVRKTAVISTFFKLKTIDITKKKKKKIEINDGINFQTQHENLILVLHAFEILLL